MKCAFYEKEITPPLGCRIPGYFNERRASGVKDKLYVKAMVIQSNDTVAIVGTDILHFPLDIREAVVKRICGSIDIKPENIMLTANHTHTGGPVTQIPDPDRGIRDSAYTDILIRSIADCVVLAYQRLSESRFKFGMGTVKGISFNRDYLIKNKTPATNPKRTSPDIIGPMTEIDYELPVLFVTDTEGNPKGSLTCFACHQDCVGGTEYSGDFSSVLSKELKKEYGGDFVSVFLAGTCGNINHIDVSREKDEPGHYIKMGKALADEAKRVIAESRPLSGENVGGRLSVLSIERAFVDPAGIEKAEYLVKTIPEKTGVKIAADDTDPDQYNRAMAKRLLDFVNTADRYDVPVQAVRICDLAVFAFPGEIFCQFGMELKEKSPAPLNIVATNANAATGYVPTEDSFYPTVYEARPGSNKLAKTGGRQMTDEALRLAAQLFEK